MVHLFYSWGSFFFFSFNFFINMWSDSCSWVNLKSSIFRCCVNSGISIMSRLLLVMGQMICKVISCFYLMGRYQRLWNEGFEYLAGLTCDFGHILSFPWGLNIIYWPENWFYLYLPFFQTFFSDLDLPRYVTSYMLICMNGLWKILILMNGWRIGCKFGIHWPHE